MLGKLCLCCWRQGLSALGALSLLWWCAHPAWSQERPAVAARSSPRKEREEIRISASYAQTWQSQRETVVLLHDNCRLQQGETQLTARQMVVWRRFDPQSTSSRELLTVFAEEARLEHGGEATAEPTLLLDLATRNGVRIQPRRPPLSQAGENDPLYQRAQQRRYDGQSAGTIQRIQYVPPAATDPGPELRSVQLKPVSGALRRVRVFPRGGTKFNVESFESRATTPPEQVWVLSGGINFLAEGLDPKLGTVDLSADRMVIWTQLGENADLSGENLMSSDTPLQVYLEGNIVIRQGTNTLRGARGFYDARADRALLLNAELKSKLPAKAGFTGAANVRVRADSLRQLSREQFQAQNAWVTTSEYGKPGYRFQVSDVFLEPRASNFNGFETDPETGERIPAKSLWATTLNDTVFVEDVPIFYLPYASFPANDMDIPLQSISVGSDRIFGVQLLTTWDLMQLLSIDRPEGLDVKWNLHADYLSQRGPEIGTSGNYSGRDRFGLQGAFKGSGATYFNYDEGVDNLGGDRKTLVPKQKERGYFTANDRWELPYDLTVLSEIGYLSDRNYYEEYREFRYDTEKDLETVVYGKQELDNWAWSALVRPRLYNYYTTTEFLPRGDLYSFSEPLLNSLLTWSSHSYVTYANQRVADPATDPNDFYSVLPFEGNGQGGIFTTRHGVDMPLTFGPLHLVPYALGEASYWGDDFTGSSVNRLYGSAGVRGNVEFWKVMPEVRSGILGLNGLAHKMVFDADYSISDSSQPLSAIPQYNEFDDNAQEQFRRRFFRNTFNLSLPPTLEPRFFGVRTGIAHNVTTPVNELVDDQQVLRLGWRNRWQTKVGPENAQRIKNWMTLDLEAAYFPDSLRDNFGEDFGQYAARYNWYVGDRTTLTAGTFFDTFDSVAPLLWNVGIISQRSTRGSLYVGLRNIEADPLNSRILTASYTYALSPKWATSLSTAYDLSENQNRGQTFTLTRIGSDFLIHLGASVDPTRDNFGIGVSVEPRFAATRGTGIPGGGSQLGSILGASPTR